VFPVYISDDPCNCINLSHYSDVRKLSDFYYFAEISHVDAVLFHYLAKVCTIIDYYFEIIKLFHKKNHFLKFKNLRSFSYQDIFFLTLLVLERICQRSSTEVSYFRIAADKFSNILWSQPHILLVDILI